nr:MAG TPA: hypothetical protein [Crassvirales sp.]
MKLLKYEGYRLSFEPEILTLKVFKKLYTRDRTKDKSRFLQELGLIYFYADPRSDYQYLIDEDERLKAIVEGEGLPNDFRIDKDLQSAIDYYSTFKTTSALLLEDTRAMIEGYRKKIKELTTEMESLEIKEIKDLGMIIKQIPSLIKDLDEAEKAVTKEIVQNDKVRGAVEKSMYEDL